MIQIDGDFGALLVDGKPAELFGELAGCDIRRDLPECVPPFPAGPNRIGAITCLPVVEVTLRLPLGPADQLTLVRGTRIDSEAGPTAPTGTAADVQRAWDELDVRKRAIDGSLSDVADRIDRLAALFVAAPKDGTDLEEGRCEAALYAYQTAAAIVREAISR